MNFSDAKYSNYLGTPRRKVAATGAVLAIIFGALFYFGYELRAISDSSAPPKVFEVKSGDGFRSIVLNLKNEGLIKSAAAFKLLSVVTGSAFKLKPGLYKLSPSMTSYKILGELILGSRREVTVKIPEGANVYEIDKILSQNGITKNGDLPKKVFERKLEGRLFPDTYKFFTDSDPEEVINKFLANFKLKTKDLGGDTTGDALILASILEKEVPDPKEQRVVAGILNKRLAAGIPLQVDATICYMKEVRTYLKNTSARDMSQFPQDQGATTKVYPMILRGGSDTGIAEIGHIPSGLRRISGPAALRLGRSASSTAPSASLADTRYSLATRAGGIFEIGSTPNHDANCSQLSTLDFKISSPYNTYLHRGLPPGPIGNPGLSAMESALNPADSPYLFYLSDLETGKTVFAETLEEHIKNKARYLQK